MKWPDLFNNLLHYIAFMVLMAAWYYLATKPGGFADTAAGGQMIGVIQAAMAAVGGVKGIGTALSMYGRYATNVQALVGNGPSTPQPPTDNVGLAQQAQSGFIRPQLLALLAALGLGVTVLAGCPAPVVSQSQAPVTAASQAESQYQAAMSYHNAICLGWSVAYQAALALRQAGAASPTLIKQINLNEQALNTACSPPFPTTAAAVTQQATQVATEVGLIEYTLKKENTK